MKLLQCRHRKQSLSVKFVSAILGPKMAAPILRTPGKNAFFSDRRKKNLRTMRSKSKLLLLHAAGREPTGEEEGARIRAATHRARNGREAGRAAGARDGRMRKDSGAGRDGPREPQDQKSPKRMK